MKPLKYLLPLLFMATVAFGDGPPYTAPQSNDISVITGGTIDGTTIGATTPSTGVFTGLTSQGIEATAGCVIIEADLATDDDDQWRMCAADGGDITIETYQSGAWVAALTLTNAGVLAGIGTVNLDSLGNFQVGGVGFDALSFATTGTLHGGIESIADDNSLSAAQCYGSIDRLTGAETSTLPAAVAGMSVMPYSTDATVKTIDPNGTDHIWLNGVDNGAGNSINSPGAVGDFIVLVAYSNNNWFSLGRSGIWIDTP